MAQHQTSQQWPTVRNQTVLVTVYDLSMIWRPQRVAQSNALMVKRSKRVYKGSSLNTFIYCCPQNVTEFWRCWFLDPSMWRRNNLSNNWIVKRTIKWHLVCEWINRFSHFIVIFQTKVTNIFWFLNWGTCCLLWTESSLWALGYRVFFPFYGVKYRLDALSWKSLYGVVIVYGYDI